MKWKVTLKEGGKVLYSKKIVADNYPLALSEIKKDTKFQQLNDGHYGLSVDISAEDKEFWEKMRKNKRYKKSVSSVKEKTD
jgi:hypothetical protein